MPHMINIVSFWSMGCIMLSSCAMEPPGEYPPNQTELELHWHNFFKGKTKKKRPVPKKIPQSKTQAQKLIDRQALRVAVATNDLETVETLLTDDIDPNALHNVIFRTTLHQAALMGHGKLLHRLLHHPKIKTEASDTELHTALFYAVDTDCPSCVGHLVEHRAWIGPDEFKDNAFHLAAQMHNTHALVSLLTHCIQDREEDGHQQDASVTLRAMCLSKMLNQFQDTLQKDNNQEIRRLWYNCMNTLPHDLIDELCFLLTEAINFCDIRRFTRAFSGKKRKKVADRLAPYYAQRHLINLHKHLTTQAQNKGTPNITAYIANAPTIIKRLTHLQRYCSTLASILHTVDHLKPHLAENPEEQDPFKLFCALFSYRLQGNSLKLQLKI